MPVRTAKTKMLWQHQMLWGCREIRSFTHSWSECTKIVALQNTWAVSFKFINGITRRPSNCTLGDLSQKMKIYFHTEIWTGMFIPTLFVTAKMNNSPMTFGEWRWKNWYIHTTESCSPRKRNKYWYKWKCGWISSQLCWAFF